MTDLIEIGWRIRNPWDTQHYWRGRERMKLAISACWKVAPQEGLQDAPGADKCRVCLFHEDHTHWKRRYLRGEYDHDRHS